MSETPKDRSGDSSRTPNLNPADFGISPQEESEMAGRALGEHLYDSLEMMMTGRQGGFRDEAKAKAMEKMRGFPAHAFGIDEDGDPYVHIKTGNWTSTWHGGGYITHTHKKHGPLEVTNLTDYSNPEHGPFGKGPHIGYNELIEHHHNFLKHVWDNYPQDMQ